MPEEMPKGAEQPNIYSLLALKTEVLSTFDVSPTMIPPERKGEQYAADILDAVSNFYRTFTPSQESKDALEKAKKVKPPEPRQKFEV